METDREVHDMGTEVRDRHSYVILPLSGKLITPMFSETKVRPDNWLAGMLCSISMLQTQSNTHIMFCSTHIATVYSISYST